MTRPSSLLEVVGRARDSRSFHFELADFLDEFRRLRRFEMLVEEPPRLGERYAGGEVADAYVAAVAVSLAREIGAVPPRWARDDSRKLRHPWFAHPGAALRATLLAESPAPFRERNLFVSENALSRA